MNFDSTISDIRTMLAETTALGLEKKKAVKLNLPSIELSTKIENGLREISKRIDKLEEDLSDAESFGTVNQNDLKKYEEDLLSLS